MNDEFKRTCREGIVTLFEVLSRKFAWEDSGKA
jgi:hypothetical protein